jgi:hypothetical protein
MSPAQRLVEIVPRMESGSACRAHRRVMCVRIAPDLRRARRLVFDELVEISGDLSLATDPQGQPCFRRLGLISVSVRRTVA